MAEAREGMTRDGNDVRRSAFSVQRSSRRSGAPMVVLGVLSIAFAPHLPLPRARARYHPLLPSLLTARQGETYRPDADAERRTLNAER